jgi:hypothetical protein
MEQQTYKLISGTGDTILISERAAKQSGLLKTCIQDDPNITDFPIPNLSTEILTIVVGILEKLSKNEPFPIVELKDEKLKELKNASNYLDIKQIMDYCVSNLKEAEK